ncbi:MAG: hypothetical protein ACYC26_11990 [Phycisphaerales bacterium]
MKQGRSSFHRRRDENAGRRPHARHDALKANPVVESLAQVTLEKLRQGYA